MYPDDDLAAIILILTALSVFFGILWLMVFSSTM